MKVLVATKRTQGWRSDDFIQALDGELVRLPTDSCDRPANGDHRAVHGLGSRAHTTTYAVVDRPQLDVDEYRWIMREDLVVAESLDTLPAEEREEWLDEFIGFHVDAAEHHSVDDVLELRGGVLQVRWTLAGGMSDR